MGRADSKKKKKKKKKEKEKKKKKEKKKDYCDFFFFFFFFFFCGSPNLKKFQAPFLRCKLRVNPTDLKTWMAGSAENLMQSGRHIGPVKKPS